MSPTQDGPTTNIFMLVSYASRFSRGHIFRYAFGNGFERFVIARFAQVSQIRLSERPVAAFQFVRERDVLDAAFLWYARVASATASEGFRTAGAEVKDAGNAVFPEPQVDVSHVAHVDEVALEAVAAFKQFRAFAIIQLGIEVESDARHAAFVAFARPVDVKVAEADDLRIGFRQDLADVFVEQEFGVAVNVQRLFVLAGLDESRWCVRHRWPRRRRTGTGFRAPRQ